MKKTLILKEYTLRRINEFLYLIFIKDEGRSSIKMYGESGKGELRLKFEEKKEEKKIKIDVEVLRHQE